MTIDTRDWRDDVERLADLSDDARDAALATLPPERRARITRLLAALDASGGVHSVDRTALELLADAPGEREDLSGTRLGDDVLVAPLSSGGSSDVYVGERHVGRARRPIALKVPRREWIDDARLTALHREYETLAALRHDGIVAFVDTHELPDGRPVLVMDHVDGLPITAWCREHDVDLRGRVALVADTARAVHHAHARLVLHRDVKPSNVLVTPDGVVKLVDFGSAAPLDGTDTPSGGVSLGYAAPEQLTGGAATVATDVHGLGLVLYELLTRRRAPTVDAIGTTSASEAVDDDASGLPRHERRRIARSLRGDLDAIAAKALRTNPAERYASAAALEDDLRRWLAREPISLRPTSPGARLRSFARRRPGALVALAVVAGLVAAGWAGTWLGKRAAERDASRGWGAHAEARVAAVFVTDALVDGRLARDPATPVDWRALDAGVRDDLADLGEARALVHLSLGRLALARGEHDVARAQLEAARATTRLNRRDDALAAELLAALD